MQCRVIALPPSTIGRVLVFTPMRVHEVEDRGSVTTDLMDLETQILSGLSDRVSLAEDGRRDLSAR